MYDILIKNGILVDGTGAPRTKGDIAIDGDTIVAVGEVTGDARRVIDAEGHLVTPGWVDIHTHYDGQATWDPPTQAGVAGCDRFGCCSKGSR